jgi:hypothetical protein
VQEVKNVLQDNVDQVVQMIVRREFNNVQAMVIRHAEIMMKIHVLNGVM